MISWLAIVGKVIEFVLTKVTGKAIELKMDEKKAACKAFVRLHDALEEVEAFTTNAINNLEAMAHPTRPSFTGWASALPEQLRKSNDEFETTLAQVAKAMSFHDPNLSAALGLVRQTKRRIKPLEAMLADADYFLYTRKPGKEPDEIAFTEPDERLADAVADILEERYTAGVTLDEAADPFVPLAGHSTRQVIVTRDRPALVRLHDALRIHLQTLSAVREQLQAFIKQQFTLADLLYVTKG